MKTIKIYSSLFWLVFSIISCSKSGPSDSSANNPRLASLQTLGASNITAFAFTTGGNISSDGGNAVTSRGVCYSTSQSPTISNAVVNSGSGTGDFVCNIIGLEMNKTYYVRSFATNAAGTAYGDEKTVSTKAFITKGTLTEMEGNNYNRIIIGNQEWLQENLDVSHYRNGDPIPQDIPLNQNNLVSGIWNYYNQDPNMGSIYNKLYNWYAVNDSRGLAPAGWHIPTKAEWLELCNYLGGESVAGGKLKQTGTSLWRNQNYLATNTSGFTGLPGGLYISGFASVGYSALWWGADSTGLANANGASCVWHLVVGFDYGNAYLDSMPKNCMLSVRCIKD